MLDRLKRPEIQKIQPLWVDNSTTDWFLVVIQLHTYLGWTILPVIPLSDFDVGPVQTSWNSKIQALWVGNSSTDWLVPSSIDSTWDIPSTDSTERLWCKTGSKLPKFKKNQPLRLDPKRSFCFGNRWISALTAADKGRCFSSSTQQLKCKTGSNVLKFPLDIYYQ